MLARQQGTKAFFDTAICSAQLAAARTSGLNSRATCPHEARAAGGTSGMILTAEAMRSNAMIGPALIPQPCHAGSPDLTTAEIFDPLVTSPEAGRNQRQAGEAKRMAWLTQGRTRGGSPGMHDRLRVCTPAACPHMIRAHGCGPSCPSVSSVSRPVSRHALTRHYDHRRPDARAGNMFWIGVRYIWALTSCLRPKSSACRACMMD